jgi:hypothetical protein
MVEAMHDEFGIDQDRALQFTNRVRRVAADPTCTEFQEAGLLDDSFQQVFVSNLVASLSAQQGDTLEAKWNTLVREFGLYALIGEDVLLYDPSQSRFDEHQTLVSEDGDSITVQQALLTAWERGLPVEETERGIRLGQTLFRPPDESNHQNIADSGNSRPEPGNPFSSFNRPLDKSRFETDPALLALAEVEFPEMATDTDRAAAVAAVRRYVRDEGGASRDDILEALNPEKNHPMGANGVQARAKGLISPFRDWWWTQIVEPGLRVLPDIRPPVSEAGVWFPDDAFESGFEDQAQVETILEESYLFELAVDEGAKTRRYVAVHDEIMRPSAKPLDGPPVFRFRPLGADESTTVRLPDIHELQPLTPEDLPTPVREQALASVTAVLRDDGDRIPDNDIELVVGWLHSDDIDADVALSFLGTALDSRSDSVPDTVLDEIETILTDRPSLFTDEATASPAAKCAGLIAEIDPARIIDIVPVLATTVESGTVETHKWIVYALSSVADEYPEELMPALGTLVDTIESEEETVRTNALSTIGQIADSYPDAAAPLTSQLADLLETDDEKCRANAVGLLADIATTHPESVVEYAPEIANCLNAADDQSRLNASIALLRAGEADPWAIRNEASQLETALADSQAGVRAIACTLIANAGATDTIDRLEAVAATDPDDDVRERANRAINRLT